VNVRRKNHQTKEFKGRLNEAKNASTVANTETANATRTTTSPAATSTDTTPTPPRKNIELKTMLGYKLTLISIDSLDDLNYASIQTPHLITVKNNNVTEYKFWGLVQKDVNTSEWKLQDLGNDFTFPKEWQGKEEVFVGPQDQIFKFHGSVFNEDRKKNPQELTVEKVDPQQWSKLHSMKLKDQQSNPKLFTLNTENESDGPCAVTMVGGKDKLEDTLSIDTFSFKPQQENPVDLKNALEETVKNLQQKASEEEKNSDLCAHVTFGNQNYTATLGTSRTFRVTVKDNDAGCDLIRMSKTPIEKDIKNIVKDQYIITDNGLWFVDCTKKSLEKLSFLNDSSLLSLLKELKFVKDHLATKAELRLITSCTGHIHDASVTSLYGQAKASQHLDIYEDKIPEEGTHFFITASKGLMRHLTKEEIGVIVNENKNNSSQLITQKLVNNAYQAARLKGYIANNISVTVRKHQASPATSSQDEKSVHVSAVFTGQGSQYFSNNFLETFQANVPGTSLKTSGIDPNKNSDKLKQSSIKRMSLTDLAPPTLKEAKEEYKKVDVKTKDCVECAKEFVGLNNKVAILNMANDEIPPEEVPEECPVRTNLSASLRNYAKEKQRDLVWRSELPDNDKRKAQFDKIYLSPEGKYIFRDAKKGLVQGEINLPFEERLKQNDLNKPLYKTRILKEISGKYSEKLDILCYHPDSFGQTDVLYLTNTVVDKKEFNVNVITSASLQVDKQGNYYDKDGVYSKEVGRAIQAAKIYNQINVAIKEGNEAIVLPAFGCGDFKNNPGEIARLYREILSLPEFNGKIKVNFAIKQKTMPFDKEFSTPLEKLNVEEVKKIKAPIIAIQKFEELTNDLTKLINKTTEKQMKQSLKILRENIRYVYLNELDFQLISSLEKEIKPKLATICEYPSQIDILDATVILAIGILNHSLPLSLSILKVSPLKHAKELSKLTLEVNNDSSFIERFEKISFNGKDNKIYGYKSVIQKTLESQKSAKDPNYILVRQKTLLGKNQWYLYHLGPDDKLVTRNVEQDPALRDLSAILKDKNFADVRFYEKVAIKYAINDFFSIPKKIVGLAENTFALFDQPNRDIIKPEKFWSNLVSSCKKYQNSLLRSRTPKVDLLCRAIVEFEANFRYWPNIKTLDELIIAQQKREAINNYIDQERKRLKKGDMKLDAYQALANNILNSKENETLSQLLEEGSKSLTTTVTHNKGKDYPETIEGILSYKRGIFTSEADSKKALDKLRDELVDIDPRTVLDFLSEKGDKNHEVQMDTEARLLKALKNARNFYNTTSVRKKHLKDFERLISDAQTILAGKGENKEKSILQLIQDAYNKEKRHFTKPSFGFFAKAKTDKEFENLTSNCCGYYEYPKLLSKILAESKEKTNQSQVPPPVL
jgi:hypothetical protein